MSRVSKVRMAKRDLPQRFESANEIKCGCAMKARRLQHFRRGCIVGFALALLSSPALQGGGPDGPEHATPRPAWLHEMPLVIVSNHDSMPIFQRRRGGNPAWQEDDYERRALREAGSPDRPTPARFRECRGERRAWGQKHAHDSGARTDRRPEHDPA